MRAVENTTMKAFTTSSMATSLMNRRIFTASFTRDRISPERMVSKKRCGSERRCRW